MVLIDGGFIDEYCLTCGKEQCVEVEVVRKTKEGVIVIGVCCTICGERWANKYVKYAKEELRGRYVLC